jgi:3',5'-nucleoside bisphosphate phosphatase
LSIDLHIHSTASDGTLTPTEIVIMAHRQNLAAIALTDHDTIAGVEEARLSAKKYGVEFVSGIEISTNPPKGFNLKGSLHILGYGIRIDDPDLTAKLDRLQEARRNRNPKIIERLNRLGIDIKLSEVQEAVITGQLGRPHIARVMVKKGQATTINNAFGNYLGQGRPAYVDKFRIECAQAIEMIRQAGGVAVLAHPALIDIADQDSLGALIKKLTTFGMQGLEVYYPEHTQKDVAHYAALAKSAGLFETGGTDFHGSLKPDIRMGCGAGDLSIPARLYKTMIKHIET